ERNNLEKCVEQVKLEMPELMEEDHVTKKDVEQKKNSDAKVAAKFIKLLAATTLTKHGAAIAGTGLGAVKLQHCEPVLCAGDLKYKLDQTGLHQCTWNCPTGQVPALFQSVGAEMMEELQEVTPLDEEKKDVQEAIKEADTVASSPKEFEKSQALAQVNKLKLRFHEALGNETLKLSQTASPTNMGNVKTSAIRYHGKCSPPEKFEGELKRAVLFQGDQKEIPKGSVVEVTRLLPGSKALLACCSERRGSAVKPEAHVFWDCGRGGGTCFLSGSEAQFDGSWIQEALRQRPACSERATRTDWADLIHKQFPSYSFPVQCSAYFLATGIASCELQDDEVEVTYQGKAYVVKSKDLQRTAVGKVSVDEGLQDWLLSTGDTIKVQMPPKQQDPKEVEVLWFPVDKDKGA
ncbi:unnamed protein product, partial [Symbiodinium sp. CCMP2456]